jgi:cytochrome c553
MKRVLLAAGLSIVFGLSAAQAAGHVQAGKAKAAACMGCHGVNGEGITPNLALAGNSEGRLLQAMKNFKSGKWKNAAMAAMMHPLSDQEMENLAAYYASLK